MSETIKEKMQKIMWTGLPFGLYDGGLKISVYISPRLEYPASSKPELSSFPDFEHWAAKIQNVEFKVQFDGGHTIDAVKIVKDGDTILPRPDLWDAVFKATTPLSPRKPASYSRQRVISYPAPSILSLIKDIYQNIAINNPTEFPLSEHLLERYLLRCINFQSQKVIDTGIEEMMQGRHTIENNEFSSSSGGRCAFARNAFVQFGAFHRPRNANRVQNIKGPEIDFHTALSILNQYPKLLRMLGLVVDLKIPVSVTEIPPSSKLRIIPTMVTQYQTQHILPWTAYITSPSFMTGSRTNLRKVHNGLLLLDQEHIRYSSLQVDLDSAGLKLMNLSRNLTNAGSAEHKTWDTPTVSSLPALRSAGISIAISNRASQLHNDVTRMDGANNEISAGKYENVILNAEDVLRGFRIDVFEARQQKWFSLCSRKGSYTFSNINTTTEVSDEGFVTTAVTSAADSSSNDLYLQESLFRWDGWSLSVPRPGKTINPGDAVERIKNTDPHETFSLSVNFSPIPGTLPQLRFGSDYRIRVRSVDLAGNSLSLDNPILKNTQALTNLIRYLRFDPISSPTMVLTRELTKGESLERLVIRSDYDTPCKETSSRHIAPPKTSQQMAEHHRKFDNAVSGKLDENAYNIIASHDGSFGRDMVEPAPQLQITYLPDPLSKGAAFYGLPRAVITTSQDGAYLQSFYPNGKWENTSPPNALPFRIEIIPYPEGNGGSSSSISNAPDNVLQPNTGSLSNMILSPKWDSANRVLRVHLKKSEVCRVFMSSYPDSDDLDLMGIWNWIKEKYPSQVLNIDPVKRKAFEDLKRLASQGRHWMITPSRVITLVHAVKRPLVPAEFENLIVSSREETSALLQDDRLTVHGASTSKIEILAEWLEPVDAPPNEWKLIGRARPFERKIGVEEKAINIQFKHEFGDTKYRRVKYTIVSTTRFQEYFDNGPFTRISKRVKEIKIPNSVKPPTPRILYVVPAFKWNKQDEVIDSNFMAEKVKRTSIREGGWLRVYLDRPWYVSGEEEYLGVVLWPATGSDLEGERNFVSLWGRDPIWKSNNTGTLTLQHFKNGSWPANDVVLEEIGPAKPVHVYGHRVFFDREKGLWYCDIKVLNRWSYYPFIRLALVRYQKNSLREARVSNVVLADFIQLAPDRNASVITDRSRQRISVSVIGRSHEGGSHIGTGGSKDNEILVSIERITANPQAGNFGWVQVMPEVLLIRTDIASPDHSIWSGDIALPPNVGGGNSKLRIVIKEFETFTSDNPEQLPAKRMIYADIVEI